MALSKEDISVIETLAVYSALDALLVSGLITAKAFNKKCADQREDTAAYQVFRTDGSASIFFLSQNTTAGCVLQHGWREIILKANGTLQRALLFEIRCKSIVMPGRIIMGIPASRNSDRQLGSDNHIL